MPWNEPGGDKDPWSGNKNKSSKNNNASDKVTELFSSMSDGDGGKFLFLLPLIALALWVFAGIYTVNAGERGVVLQFGKFKDITEPGLHWVPVPVSTVEIVDIKRIKTTKDQTTMLTKDENIVDLGVEVQYHIAEPQSYLFHVRNVDNDRDPMGGVLYQVMRSAVREIVGSHDIDYIILEGRDTIEIETLTLMQSILDEYKTGLKINKMNLTYAEAPEKVKDAFDDANRAREDFEKVKNNALSYSNKVLPQARGRAARLVEEAQAYKEKVMLKAKGDAARFTSLVAEYQKAPEVTRERLYLDTLETVFSSGGKKVMMDNKGGNNVFYLPLNTDSDTSKAKIPPVPPQIINSMKNTSKAAAQLRESSRFSRETTTGSSLREAR